MKAMSELMPAGFANVIADLAAKKVAGRPPVTTRTTLLDSVRKGLLRNEIVMLEFTSAANGSYNKKAGVLWTLATAKNIPALEATEVGGVNTYARALRSYRDLLVAHLKGAAKASSKAQATLTASHSAVPKVSAKPAASKKASPAKAKATLKAKTAKAAKKSGK